MRDICYFEQSKVFWMVPGKWKSSEAYRVESGISCMSKLRAARCVFFGAAGLPSEKSNSAGAW